MLEFLIVETLSWSFYILKIFGLILILEMLLLRLPLQQYKLWYYSRQGVPFFRPVYPILSNFYQFVQLMRRKPKVEYSPFYPLVKEQFGSNPPGVVGAITFFNALLIINKPEYLTDIFINKSLYVDKDQNIKM